MRPSEEHAIQGYREAAVQTLKLSFPQLTNEELSRVVDETIDRKFKNSNIKIVNNYLKSESKTTLLEVANYIVDRQPIITPSGVMFSRHGTLPNPLVRMIEVFLENRDKDKAEMFKYPKGSEMYTRYNLLQLLDKIDANGTYGTLGTRTCIYYNIYVAGTITHQGYSCISAAALLFESFLANNVGFSSLNDLVTFINNVVHEDRHWPDSIVRQISRSECFRKLIITCKFDYIPSENDMAIVWNMLWNLSDSDINRLYYKNNLYEFVENEFVINKVKSMLCKLHLPYINPYKPPKEIIENLDEFWDLLKEFVYYDKQLVDRLGKMANIIRDVSIIMDTDSSIVSLDAWYRFVLDKTYDIDMDIKHHIYSPFVEYKTDEFGDRIDLINPIMDVNPPLTYDFYDDEVIEMEVSVNHDEIVPQDGLRYSIINIMAYCMTKMINDFMYKYAEQSNALHPVKKCFFIMKNEYLFKRAIDTDGKKNYATIQELQEGNMIPEDKRLDIKGLPINKVGLNPSIKNKLQKILYDDILNATKIDQLTVLKKLAMVERGIYESITNGSKEFYKPAIIKSMSHYDNPMRIQGIKASLVYNSLKSPELEPIDLTKRNSIDIAKINLNRKNVDKLKDKYPDVYERAVDLLNQKEFSDGITAIAIPLNQDVPEWVIDLIEYTTIINDNIKNFPLECIGLSQTPNDHVNYSNIISI
jgi:hypothetical protein